MRIINEAKYLIGLKFSVCIYFSRFFFVFQATESGEMFEDYLMVFLLLNFKQVGLLLSELFSSTFVRDPSFPDILRVSI